ncbi:hypothetical protein GCM10027019_13850 [Melaminivora jejuensis]|uniref:hypothetical protein n=1 Tax=Melaminivora jejuensis TaxID=1267217 RepID=UPI001AE0087E|nr:hypothetical protein [Melaminivora jejuensis]UHJ65948.1 hypothetical protein LVC68_05385 [Melaminivora jejuensis]
MDYLLQGMFGEKSLTKVVALFDDKASAEAMVGRVLRLPGMEPSQVRLLSQADLKTHRADLFGRKMEPEQSGIFHTAFRAHLVAGFAGFVLGLLLYAYWMNSGHVMVTSSPMLAFIAIVGFATTFGLLLGGLVTLRPDHVRVIAQVRSALRAGRWALVVHPTDSHQTEQAQELLEGSSARVMRTL